MASLKIVFSSVLSPGDRERAMSQIGFEEDPPGYRYSGRRFLGPRGRISVLIHDKNDQTHVCVRTDYINVVHRVGTMISIMQTLVDRWDAEIIYHTTELKRALADLDLQGLDVEPGWKERLKEETGEMRKEASNAMPPHNSNEPSNFNGRGLIRLSGVLFACKRNGGLVRERRV